jgi:GYF domain 2/Domain of unknown function (DUF4234)
MNYWVAPGGQQQGPFSLADVRKMIADGRVASSDLAWTEGLPNWAPVSQVIPAEVPAYTPVAPAAPIATPAAAQPNYAALGAQAAPAAGPVPPNLHWALVLIFAMFTFGIFGIVWIFVESSFVKKIDPRNVSRALFVVAFLLEFAYVGLMVFAGLAGSPNDVPVIAGMGSLIGLLIAVCAVIAIFKMRSSLVQYYNTIEPIGLKLSGVMTFFFSIYYFQHHFTRIAEWKRTGQLVPQQ